MYFTRYFIEHEKHSGEKLLLNTLTGAVTPIIDKYANKLEQIKKGDFSNISPYMLYELIMEGYIFKSKEQEDELIKKFQKNVRDASRNKPLTYFLHLTYNCNLSCNYCNYSGIKRENTILDKNDINKAFSAMWQIQKNYTGKNITIVLFGGEPFMAENKEVVEHCFRKYKAFAQKARKAGKNCSLLAFSNGVELPEYKDLFKKNKDMIDSLFVTVNGPREIHDSTRIYNNGSGSYDDTVKGIDTLISAGIPMWLVANIDRTNIKYLPEISKLISEKEWDKSSSFFGCCVSRVKNRNGDAPNSFSEHEMIEEIISMTEKNEIDPQKFNFEDMRILKNIMKFFGFEKCSDKNCVPSIIHQLNGCGNRSSQYAFTVDGYIYPCSPAAGNTEYAIGKYKPEFEIAIPKDKCWNSRSVLEMEGCSSCKCAFICGGGCAYEANEKNGSVYKAVCTNTERIIHAYLYSLELKTGITHKETVYGVGG